MDNNNGASQSQVSHVSNAAESRDQSKKEVPHVRHEFYPNFLMKLIFRKYLNLRNMIYCTQTETIFGKPFEYWLIMFLFSLIIIGVGIIIALLVLKLMYCTRISRMLLRRISQMQVEKVKLLKIMNEFRSQNPLFFQLEEYY